MGVRAGVRVRVGVRLKRRGVEGERVRGVTVIGEAEAEAVGVGVGWGRG